MCGIVAAFDKKVNVNNDILLQFEDQSSRGTNGFGSIFFDEKGKYDIERSTGQIKAIIDIKLRDAKQMIFHHRMPSSSKNKISQTHPILIESGDLKNKYLIVHNGVIHNSDDRREYHEKELGYHYSTLKEEKTWGDNKDWMYNDSETLGYDIARFIEGQTKEVKAAGSAAFIIARISRKTDKINRIYFGRNTGNPLMLASNGKTRISLSSEGKGTNIKEDLLYSFKLTDYKISKKKMSVPTTAALTKEQEKKAKEEEAKSKGTDLAPAKKVDDYDWADYPVSKNLYNSPIMLEEDAEEIEKFLDEARGEIDAVSDAILDAYDDQNLYMFDVEDSVRRIAKTLNQAVQTAQDAKTRAYFDEEDQALAEKKAAKELDKTLAE